LRGASLPYPHFDRTVGWGHVFASGDNDGNNNDNYELLDHTKYTQWAFHGDFADQGLLYQWVKYEEKSVSIIFHDGIQNWGVSSTTAKVVLVARHNVGNIFQTNTARVLARSLLFFSVCLAVPVERRWEAVSRALYRFCPLYGPVQTLVDESAAG
jgi:hypothetical protein